MFLMFSSRYNRRFKKDIFMSIVSQEKDEYGNEITKIGRPLPVEYLLVDMPVSSPITPVSTFSVLNGDKKHFPVENRMLESSLQDFNSFAQYMNQFRSAEFLLAISDIHVLVFMAQNEIMPMRLDLIYTANHNNLFLCIFLPPNMLAVSGILDLTFTIHKVKKVHPNIRFPGKCWARCMRLLNARTRTLPASGHTLSTGRT